MARVYYTQSLIIDPEGAAVTNVNLDEDFDVEDVAILTNEVQSNGKRKVTIGIVYNNSVTAQHSISLSHITLGQGVTPVTNSAIADIQTVQFTEFVEHTIKDNTMIVTVVTFSIVGAQVNRVSTQNLVFDPAALLSAVAVTALGTVLESHMINTGSIAQPNNVGAGTVRGTALIVTQA